LAKIKERAKKERRSLNNQILKTLEESNDEFVDFTSDWPIEELREAIQKGMDSESFEVQNFEKFVDLVEGGK